MLNQILMFLVLICLLCTCHFTPRIWLTLPTFSHGFKLRLTISVGSLLYVIASFEIAAGYMGM